MIISLNLLKNFVDLNGITTDELVKTLTFSGFEVESVSTLAKAKGLVIGEIIEVKDHPNSDHLHVLKVDEGKNRGIKQIVCGAKNVKEHLHVIVATVGAIIGNDDIKINASTIRGVESEGMCCSLLELGVDKSLLSEYQQNGIEELPSTAPVGEEEVLKYLGLDDTLLEVTILANRSDCLSIYSFSKEVASLLKRKVTINEYSIPSQQKSDYTVLSKSENCKQFALRVIKNINVKPSPKWLSQALRSQGIRSINNIVDIGNYVMLLEGRPLHIYDLDKIKTKNFIVRDDIEGDFLALDEKTYKLEKGDIVITDGDTPLSLGGIMGSLSCAIDEKTKNIAIECASFVSARIRKTSSRIGLSSDSSSYFIKGINPSNEKETIELASYLLKEYADATNFFESIFYDVRQNVENKINCTYSYINHRLGTNIPSNQMDEVFSSFAIKIVHLGEDKFLAYPPSYRIDLKCDANLSEEIFRTIGLNEIKPTLPLIPMTLGQFTQEQKHKRLIREHLISIGLHEVLTYTLISQKAVNECALLTENNTAYKILHPMTIDHVYVRKSLIASLLDVVIYNHAHQENNVAIFEISSLETKENNFSSLAIILNGEKSEVGILKKRKYDFFDISGIFNAILTMLGISLNRLKLIPLKTSEYFHPGRSVEVLLNNKRIGVFGELHPSYLKNKDLDTTIALEINLSELFNMKTSPLKMSQISKYPAVKRDYAFVIKKDIAFKDIELAIKKSGSSLISKIEIFDIYEGEHIISGFKSIALRLTYISMDHTLKEQEINDAENKAIKAITTLGASLRK